MNAQVLLVGLAVAAAGAVAVTTMVAAQGNPRHDHGSKVVRTVLSGYNEDPLALSTPARGAFVATVDKRDQEIRYVLRYDGIETATLQAHIHFGRPHGSMVIVPVIGARNVIPRDRHLGDIVSKAGRRLSPGSAEMRTPE